MFDEQGNFLTRRVETLVPAKHFTWQKPTLCAEFTDRDGGVEIAVSSDVFTKGVFIDFRDFDCVLSDNFFALTDKAPYRVFARTGKTAAELGQLPSQQLQQAVHFGNAAGSLTTMKSGAIPAMPTQEEIEACLKTRKLMEA